LLLRRGDTTWAEGLLFAFLDFNTKFSLILAKKVDGLCYSHLNILCPEVRQSTWLIKAKSKDYFSSAGVVWNLR
jgi:hypothetical protein